MRIFVLFIFLSSCIVQNPTDPKNDPTPGDANGTKDTSALQTIYDFPEQGRGKWRVQDDVVMGGRSDSKFVMTDDGNGRFFGKVSLENNGGFCSVQHTTNDNPFVVKGKSAFSVQVNGDGKDYNFRVRTPNGRHAYNYTFQTKGDKWETVLIPFDAMKATFHGESVDVPNYAGEDIREIQILIGNKKAETFELLLMNISAM
ncbi:CIA30 family protein [Neolewinella antarctica]|uniref:NADH:ubiquinone oxidoreductase intermediate-associated protein 30 domain-containing protein n=1 Tax=Neolewinella antarctica TaxID=442734 RepID=A0ABX0XBI2_9BACT|nr:CIA30 family protein [Neolewinella antarctica]NJC26633.1 hypothetical protein [Neolewinella antarctica]